MFIIFISWIYIAFTTINLGYGCDKIIGVKNNNLVVTSILGLFCITIITSCWAFFGRINSEFHLFLVIVNGFCFFKFKKQLLSSYVYFYRELRSLILPLKVILAALFLLILAQCSASPYLLDNESYYIQTIKWINEYGFVKGLANLHIFFGQTSGWHIAQSAFSFSFIYKNFNDLSGFYLLLGTIFSLLKLNEYFKNSSRNYLIIGLFPLANVFFFQFISAPSPDIPVYICTLLLFYYFIENYSKCTIENFNLMVILILFILYIKPTSIALIILPIILIAKNVKEFNYKIIPILSFCICLLTIYLYKNCIITGYPFFPVRYFALADLKYAIPKEVIDLYFNETRMLGFFISRVEYNSMSTFQIILKWLFASKIDGVIHVISIIILAVSPFFIYKYFHKRSVWIVYATILLQMVVLFLSSPQFRFFIHFIVFLAFLIASCIVKSKRFILIINYLSIVILVVLVFVPIDLKLFTSNKQLQKTSVCKLKNAIFPHSNSKFSYDFITIKNGNLLYNSPVNPNFFWGNGDGELPCVNKEQLDYFEKQYKIVPQMISNDFKDGFYAKKINP